MMYFKKLEVENIGPHRSRSWDFSRGLVGIYGPNGSGKSTLVESLAFALTGKFPGNSPRATWIYDQADPGAAAFVKLIFALSDGTEVMIRRELDNSNTQRNRVRLEIPGEPAITTTDKASERIAALLGCTNDDIDLMIFRRQGQLDDFIVMRDSDRKKYFARLFGLARCERIYNTLREEITADKITAATLAKDHERLREEAAIFEHNRERITELQKILKDYEKSLISEEQIKQLREILATEQQLKEVLREFETAQQQKELHQKNLEKAKTAFLEARIEKSSLEVQKTQYDLAAELAANFIPVYKAKFAAAQAFKSIAKEYEKSKNDLAAAKSALTEIDIRVEKTASFGKLQRLKNQEKKLIAESMQISAMKQFYAQVFNSLSTSEEKIPCPVCGTKVKMETLADHKLKEIEKAEKQQQNLGKKLEKTQREIAAITELLQEQQKQQEIVAVAEEIYTKSHKTYTEALKEQQETSIRLEEMRKTISESGVEELVQEALSQPEHFEKKRKDLQSRCYSYSQVELEMKHAEENYTAAKSTEERLKERVKELQQIACKSEEAKNLLQVQEENYKKVMTVRAQLEVLQVQLEKQKIAISHLPAVVAKENAILRLIEIVERTREVFHHDGLPKQAAHYGLLKLTEQVNYALSLLGSPFVTSIDENTCIWAQKPGRKQQPAARLSMGQRAVLAIAFALALSNKMPVVMDEPTAHLDTDSQKVLTSALSVLASQVRGQRQVIVVTHSEAVRASLDAVLDLSC